MAPISHSPNITVPMADSATFTPGVDRRQIVDRRAGTHGGRRETDVFPTFTDPRSQIEGESGIRESGWLYTRGPRSVRLVRKENTEGCRLFVHGPETEIVVHEFADVTECMKRQAEIEFGLVAAGYQLAQQSSERRSQYRAWHPPEHRRAS